MTPRVLGVFAALIAASGAALGIASLLRPPYVKINLDQRDVGVRRAVGEIHPGLGARP